MGDRMSADEWLMAFLRSATRWASTETSAARARSGQKPRVPASGLSVQARGVLRHARAELAAIAISASHEVTIRIQYSQLQAVTQAGAAAFAAGVAAREAASGIAALGKSVSERADGAAPEVSWLSGGGRRSADLGIVELRP